jgi:ABC-type transport system involved in multi-copper enzyme maturation permease subunit
MNPLVRKELRSVAPLWIAGLAMVVAPVVLINMANSREFPEVPLPLLCFVLGWATLIFSTNAFGHEFRHDTFQFLLAQPIARGRLWWTKVGVVAAAAASLLLVLFYFHATIDRNGGWAGLVGETGLSPLERWICVLTVAAALAGGLWTTLVFRQEVAAFCISILVPGAACIFAVTLLREYPADFRLHITLLVLGVYSVFGFLLARTLFARAQDLQWSGGIIAFPGSFGRSARVASPNAVRKLRPMGALIRKELMVQQTSWLCGIALFALQVAFVTIPLSRRDDSVVLLSLFLVWLFLWLALPFLIGGLAVAEERRLGMFDNLLCHPVSRRAHFSLKLGIAMALTVVFCALMPCLVFNAGLGGGLREWPLRNLFNGGAVLGVSLLFGTMTFVSFYVSTLTRATLGGIGIAFLLNVPLFALGGWAYGRLFDASQPYTLWELPLVVHALLLTILPLWFVLAWRNFSVIHVGPSLWTRNVAWTVASLAFAASITWVVYHRTWEKFMVLEPSHATPQLSGEVRPQLCMTSGRVLALLPDGRLWMSTEFEFVRSAAGDQLIPRGGRFLPVSNCVSIASGSGVAFAVSAEGTLWRIPMGVRWNGPPSPGSIQNDVRNPEQVGSESDWRQVAVNWERVLALKRDGSIWEYSIAPWTNEEYTFTRISNPEWQSLFIDDVGGTVGVKHDGSVWISDRNRTHGVLPTEPVASLSDGSNWVDYVSMGIDYTLRTDGTLWAWSVPLETRSRVSANFPPPTQLRPDRAWRDIAQSPLLFAAVDTSGVLIYVEKLELDLDRLKANAGEPSRFSDWIAVHADYSRITAFAADGTLSMWETARQSQGPGQMLGPSRRPLWTLNIFADSR